MDMDIGIDMNTIMDQSREKTFVCSPAFWTQTLTEKKYLKQNKFDSEAEAVQTE